MKSIQRFIAYAEFALVFPAMVFMGALFARNLQPAPYEPAQSARRIVDWYAAHSFLCLDIFLIAMPLTGLVLGCVTMARGWRKDAELRSAASTVLGALRSHLAAAIIGAATLTAGSVLAIVALHMIAD